MTDDPIGEEIPEIVDQLAGSLNAPNPAAIHAGLGQRQAARKRMLGSVGAFVAVLAIAGGVLALTNDDATSTFTSDDTADASADATERPQPAVADDSAPVEFDDWYGSGEWSAPVGATVTTAVCANGFRIQTDGSTWLPGRLPAVWAGQGSVPVTAIVQRDLLIAVDEDANAARFFRHTPGNVITEPCLGFGADVIQLNDFARATLPILAAIGDISFDNSLSAIMTTRDATDQGSLVLVSPCSGSSYRIHWEDDGFTVIGIASPPARERGVVCDDVPATNFFFKDDVVKVTISPDLAILDVSGETEWQLILYLGTNSFAPTAGPTVNPPIPAGVIIDECANGSTLSVGGHEWLAWELPPEWEGQDIVQVTVMIDDANLTATDENGLTAPFVRNDGQGRVLPCVGFTYEQPSATAAPPESTVPPATVVIAPTTAAPAPAGPPAFAPSGDTGFSGKWSVVGLWTDAIEHDLGSFGSSAPSITVLGRRLSGDDGCNSHGGGLFYVITDGTARLEGGNTTNVGCPDNFAREAFTSALFNGTNWGRTSEGNLVLTNGEHLVELELTEAVPARSLAGLSAPLNTIWNSDVLHDYNNFSTDESGVALTFVTQGSGYIAVATDEECGEFAFDAIFDDFGEGSISFEPISGEAPCVPSGDSATALDALARADYFASAPWGVMLWDGPNPLAIFAAE